MPSTPLSSEQVSASLPPWPVVLRALREARGSTQEGWGARLGYSDKTVRRWERGETAPDAAAEAALVTVLQQEGLLRRYTAGPLRDITLSEADLRHLLADARSGKHTPSGPSAVLHLVREPVAVSLLHTLPLALTSFLGREQELTDLAQLLEHTRLVTLTGPGGVGKTRLALQAAAAHPATFPAGVCFVDLAPLRDPQLVPAAIAQRLGVQGLPDLPVRERVLRFVREQRLLLVLDNYEHLLDAAEFAGALLQAGPALTLLVTSRAPLRVTGEREYPVAPLPLPPGAGTANAVADNPAVELFAQRARDVRPQFRLTDDNATTVAAICTRLDGLPLAIELAAARVRSLPVAALLTRLEQRLPLLAGGARDVPARQQTLRGAISWSYDLLAAAEQRLFRRLGVFAGGCTLELTETVCNAAGDLGLDVLEGLSSLIEKSLLREADRPAGEPRYRMLETIREFALGELDASGEAETVRQQLAVQVLQLAEHAAAAGDWARLEGELDNARAVLGWCVERADLTVGVRLFWALRSYLYDRGHVTEQEAWRQRLLALPEAAPPSVSRARLLASPPVDRLSTAAQEDAGVELAEAIALSRSLRDTPCLAYALVRLAFLRLQQGQTEAAVPLAEAALPLYLSAGDAEGTASLYFALILAALARGDRASADRLLAANRALETTSRSLVGLGNEALLAEAHGDHARARSILEEVVRNRADAQGEPSRASLVQLTRLAQVMLRQGDTPAAVAACAANLVSQRRDGRSRVLPAVLQALAQAAEWCGLPGESTRLLAAAAAQRRQFAAMVLALPAEQQAAEERLRAALDEVAFTAAWAAGKALSADAAIELGLDVAAQLQQVHATDTVAAQAT